MNEFVVGFRANKEFDLLVAANFTLEGAGAATLLLSLLCDFGPGLLAGLIMVLLGVAALILDLGNPMRSWKALARTNSAWISRGSVFIGCLCILGVLYVFSPSIRNSSFALVIRTALAIFSFLTILYPGFVVSSMSSIPFWNTPLIPLLFLFHSSTTGALVLLSLLSFTGSTVHTPFNPLTLGLVLLFGTLFLLIVHVTVLSKSSSAARESVRLLTKGRLMPLHLGGAFLLGIFVPLAVVLPAGLAAGAAGAVSCIAFFITMVSRLIGDFCSRLAILRAGVYEPLIG